MKDMQRRNIIVRLEKCRNKNKEFYNKYPNLLKELDYKEDIIGAVIFCDCAWWIENRKEGRAVSLFSETAIDKVIGNLFQDIELSEKIGF